MVYLRHRNFPGIWKNLYDFPGFESTSEQLITEINLFPGIPSDIQLYTTHLGDYGPVRHQLTHRRLNVWFSCYKTLKDISLPFQAVSLDDVNLYPVPRLIARFLEDHPII
jgi:adenine-specific DNA glycosylase